MDRQIKILVVLSGLSAGGAETMYMNLYRKLDKTKYKIDFLVFPSNNGFYADEVKRNGKNNYAFAEHSESLGDDF